MIEFALTGVILSLCVLLGWKEREARLERNKLVNALLAKNMRELGEFEFNEKLKPLVPEVKSPNLAPVADLTEAEFDKLIEREVA